MLFKKVSWRIPTMPCIISLNSFFPTFVKVHHIPFEQILTHMTRSFNCFCTCLTPGPVSPFFPSRPASSSSLHYCFSLYVICIRDVNFDFASLFLFFSMNEYICIFPWGALLFLHPLMSRSIFH